MSHKISRFGWLPDLPDTRDLQYEVPRTIVRKLPSKVDLREKCSPVSDQGSIGSSTAHAIGAAIEFELRKYRTREFSASRLFIYYNERLMANTLESDSGATLRSGMKAANQKGVCPENMWPYKPDRFADKPMASCFTEALRHQISSYHRLERNLNQLKGCLAEGFPFVFGFVAYETFESEDVARSGKLNMPKKGEAPCGGHAVMAVGYHESSKRFIVRNSWGPDWGQGGYFTMPYDYLLNENLSDDFWTLRISEKQPERKKPNGITQEIKNNGQLVGQSIVQPNEYARSMSLFRLRSV